MFFFLGCEMKDVGSFRFMQNEIIASSPHATCVCACIPTHQNNRNKKKKGKKQKDPYFAVDVYCFRAGVGHI
jgi:hypothetical protein